MTAKRIMGIINLVESPPDFNKLDDDAQYFFNQKIRVAVGKFIPLEKEFLRGGKKDNFLKLKDPELWNFEIIFTETGKKVLKIIYYEGFK